MISQQDLGLIYDSVNNDLSFDKLLVPAEVKTEPRVNHSVAMTRMSSTEEFNSYSYRPPYAQTPLLPTPKLEKLPQLCAPAQEASDKLKLQSTHGGLFSLQTSSVRSNFESLFGLNPKSQGGCKEHTSRDIKTEFGDTSHWYGAELSSPSENEVGFKAVMTDLMKKEKPDIEATHPAALTDCNEPDIVICGRCCKCFKSIEELQAHRAFPQLCFMQPTCSKCVHGHRGQLVCSQCFETRPTPWALLVHAQLKHKIVMCQEVEVKRRKLLAVRTGHVCSERVDSNGYVLPLTPSPSQDEDRICNMHALAQIKSAIMKSKIDKAKLKACWQLN
ncbi:uncharacterized protein [Watersipora subatra]|uniref:uncharacterized protein isoform X2 n=1 Tax=Watersipora subatra TaxID=2589382 RepID=UPI00355C7A4F